MCTLLKNFEALLLAPKYSPLVFAASKSISLFIIMMFGLSLPATSDSSLTVSVRGARVESAFHDQKPGPYNEIFKQVIKGYEQHVKLSFAPHMRAINQVYFKKEYDCLFIGGMGYPEAIGLQPNKFVHSTPMYTSYLQIYGRKGVRFPKSVRDLAGRSIVIEVATQDTMEDFGIVFDHMKVTLIPSAVKGFELMERGRFDLTIGYEQDMVAHFGEAFYDKFERGPVVKEFKDVINCWRNPRTEAFIEHVNKRIDELQRDGYFGQLFGLKPTALAFTEPVLQGRK